MLLSPPAHGTLGNYLLTFHDLINLQVKCLLSFRRDRTFDLPLSKISGKFVNNTESISEIGTDGEAEAKMLSLSQLAVY